MGNKRLGIYYDGKNYQEADVSKMNIGNVWCRPKGTTLPELPDGMMWDKKESINYDSVGVEYYELATGPHYAKNMEDELDQKDRELHKVHRDFDEMRQQGLEQNRKLQEQADKFRNMYHEEKKLKDYYQRELGEVAEINKTLNQSLIELKESDVETVKECGINPEYVETENLHKERMRLENEKLRLDNKVTWHKLRGSEDYPVSLWHQVEFRLSKVDSFKKSLNWLWGVIVAFGINEVIQWLTR